MLVVAGPKMQEGTANSTMKVQDMYMNTFVAAKYGLDSPMSRWEMPQRTLTNVRTKILWDFQIPTGKQLFRKLTGHCGNEGGAEKQVVTDVEVPYESSIKGKEYVWMQKYQVLKDGLEGMWKM